MPAKRTFNIALDEETARIIDRLPHGKKSPIICSIIKRFAQEEDSSNSARKLRELLWNDSDDQDNDLDDIREKMKGKKRSRDPDRDIIRHLRNL